MLEAWQAAVLGIVEGVTEYLPISSTGHLILVSSLMGLSADDETWRAANTFNIVIQAGAIAAVLGLYRVRVKQMTLGLIGRDESGRRLAVNLVVAFLPAAALGPILSDTIEKFLFNEWPVVGALFAGAWLMLAVAYSRKLAGRARSGHGINEVNWKIALMIGFGQCLAMWPGTSRSMMTIVTALMLGLRPRAAAEFSFLLGLITLTAATGFKLVTGGSQMFDQFGMSAVLIGLVTATVSAVFAVKWFVALITRYGLAPFGWYRLILATVVAGMILMGWIKVPEVL